MTTNTDPRDELVAFIKANLTPYVIDWDGDNKTGYLADLERTPSKSMEEADVVSSQRADLFAPKGSHAVILDIDYPMWVTPSSTEGHYHLYIDKQIPHEGYMALVALLGHLGIIEPGYAMASIRRGHTDLRPPWVKKGEEPGRKKEPEYPVTDVTGQPFTTPVANPWESETPL